MFNFIDETMMLIKSLIALARFDLQIIERLKHELTVNNVHHKSTLVEGLWNAARCGNRSGKLPVHRSLHVGVCGVRVPARQRERALSHTLIHVQLLREYYLTVPAHLLEIVKE